jgi:hypothetical protein
MFSGAHRSIGFVSVFQNRFPLTLISRRASQIEVIGQGEVQEQLE